MGDGEWKETILGNNSQFSRKRDSQHFPNGYPRYWGIERHQHQTSQQKRGHHKEKKIATSESGILIKTATNTTMPARTWQPQYRICCLSSGDVIQKLHNSLDAHWRRACIRCMHAGHCALRRALLRLAGACSAGSFPSAAIPRELLFAGVAAGPSAPSAAPSPPSPLAASSRSESESDPDS